VALALALKHERPDLDVTATDRNAAAIDVARSNAQRLGLRVHFAVVDGVGGAYDAIVSNPPYVAETEAGTGSLPPELERHQPPNAFWAGPDGLAFYRRLVRELGGTRFVALEVGDGQADAVCALLAATAGLRCTARRRAPSGAVRVVVAERAAP
jgi:release factor glutamine methyltransferase